jgi:hypothetical protein
LTVCQEKLKQKRKEMEMSDSGHMGRISADDATREVSKQMSD